MNEIRLMNLKKTVLAVVINSFLFTSVAFAAPPGKPTIGWGEYTFSLVEIDQSEVAYEKLVKAVHDDIEIVVTWDVWSGGTPSSASILLDGKSVWEGSAAAKKASFRMSKGGIYQMVIELKNSDGVSTSDPTTLTIADTDGSHLPGMETVWTENNKPYENKTGKIVGSYFVEWGVYDRKYPVDMMPVANLNRIIYGFVPICGSTINEGLKTVEGSFQSLENACKGREDFKVAIHDPWAALQKPQKGFEGWSAPYKGNFAQLMSLKKSNPDLKILPSIGGWTLSDPFFFMDDPKKRATFVASVEVYLKTWKFFDGVDIDFEFPGFGGANPNLGNKEKDGETYVSIMRDMRAMLDRLGEEKGRYYELTSAINVGLDKLAIIDYKEASKYLDNIYLMSYDFYGAWDNTVLNHQTALNESGVNPENNEYFTSRGIDKLIELGVPAEKLVMGVAAYGRGWTGVVDYVDDNPFSGKATGPIKGTWEAGVVDYRDIVDNHTGDGWIEGYDDIAEGPYMFRPTTGDLITYDNPRSVVAKAKYVIDHNLGGIFHWEMDADNGDLVNAMHEGLGHGGDSGSDKPKDRNPLARAGADKTVIGPVEVHLNGDKSSDPEGGALKYKWTQTAGPTAKITGSDTESATVEVAEVKEDTNYTFSLTVTDPAGLSGTDDVVITNKVEVYNQPPTVDLQMMTYANEGSEITITANGKDNDGDTLSYIWDVDSQFVVTGGGNSSSITLTAPDVDADQTFDLLVLVSDGEAEVSAEAEIHVKNVVTDPEPDGNGNGGDTGGGDIGGGGETGGGETGGGETGTGDNCSANDSSASNHPTWSPETVYTTETVTHDGLVYKAKWWVQGSEPSASNEAWELLSEVDLPWNTAVAYQGNAQVNHNGSRWQAKWWTQGAEPGADEVWVNVGPATCK